MNFVNVVYRNIYKSFDDRVYWMVIQLHWLEDENKEFILNGVEVENTTKWEREREIRKKGKDGGREESVGNISEEK